MAPRLLIVQHHPAEGPGRIAAWARSRGVSLATLDATRGQWPAADAALPRLLLGGPAEVDAPPDWLREEIRQTRIAVARDVPVLGICLGAQVLAAALGAEVGPLAPEETGWCAVRFADGSVREFLQWHARGHAVPPGAEGLARSAHWPCQMYRVGPRLLGMQFHPEWDPPALAALHAAFGAPCPLPPADDHDARALARHRAAERWLYGQLDAWAACWHG